MLFENLCVNCSHKSCCTDSAVPLVFSTELKKILKINPKYLDHIQTIEINGKQINTLKKKNNSTHCVFWDGETGGCTIYESRPIDCKLYPFDIVYFNNSYHWIVYSCNQNSDWQWSEKHLQKLEADEGFVELIKNLDVFTEHTKMILPRESKKTPYVVLRKIKLRNNTINF